jgi:hypothetical protein
MGEMGSIRRLPTLLSPIPKGQERGAPAGWLIECCFLESVLEWRQKGGRFGGLNGETVWDWGLVGLVVDGIGAFGVLQVCG